MRGNLLSTAMAQQAVKATVSTAGALALLVAAGPGVAAAASPGNSRAGRGTAGAARLLPAPRAAAGRQSAGMPMTSDGLTLSWDQDGTVSVGRGGAVLALRPLSAGRGAAAESLRPGGFTLRSQTVTQTAGPGLTAWYKTLAAGFEQGFTIARRPPGSGSSVTIGIGYSGGFTASQSGPGQVTFTGRTGPALVYGGLRVTDARGRALPGYLSVGGGVLRITVRDLGAAYPVSVDPYIVPAAEPVAALPVDAASVALSSDGQEALLSAQGGGAYGTGAGYIFAESGGTWSPAPVATFSYPSDCGYSAALSGDGQTALIGCNGGSTAYLFTASSGWSSTPAAVFTAPTGVADFGHDVALSADGQTAIVGGVGTASVYTDTGGGWSAQAALESPGGPEASDGFGLAVALSADGQTALIGAPDATVASPGDGAAYLYAVPAMGWSQVGTPAFAFTGPAGEQGYFGGSVALSASGQEALIGAPFAAPSGTASGAAYLYSGSSAWSDAPEASFIQPDGTGPVFSGWSVALSGDGEAALVGFGANPAPPSDLYTAGSGWSGTPTATLNGGNANGPSVALSGDGETALTADPDTGDAYVYSTPDATAVSLSQVGGGGPAGTPVTYTGTVTDTTQSPAVPVASGTVSLYDNGSGTPFASDLPLNSAGQFIASVTYTTAGAHEVSAVYTPSAGVGPQYTGSTSATAVFTVAAPVPCGGYDIPIGSTSDVDLCSTWPAGAPPPGLAADPAGNWSLVLTGSITLPSSGEWIFCVADAADFVMDVDGQLVLTNEIYEQDGNNGDINMQFLGTYAGTMAGMCEGADLAAGQHQVLFDIAGNTSATTAYNVSYVAPGASQPAGLPLSILSLSSS